MPQSRVRTIRLVVLWGLCFLVVGVGVGWALRTVFAPAADPQTADTHTFVKVAEGEVGSVVTVNAAAQWTAVPQGVNQAVGVVTEVFAKNGEEVTSGQKVYGVDLRPVSVAQGKIPAFRDLDYRTSGADVKQLQDMLAQLELYSGQVDGVWRPSVTAAVRSWQKSLGVKQTGAVSKGDLIFLPDLPARISLDQEKLRPGTTLAGGEEAILVLPSSPRFWLPLSEGQATGITSGTTVNLTSPQGDTWMGVVGVSEAAESGGINISIESDAATGVCGDQCGQIKLGAQTLMPAFIELIAPVSGLVVPTTALVSTAQGTINVVDESGTLIPVEVTSSAKGQSVIEGVEVGTKVRVPARLASTSAGRS